MLVAQLLFSFFGFCFCQNLILAYYNRKRQVAMQDPVHTVVLQEYVQAQVIK